MSDSERRISWPKMVSDFRSEAVTHQAISAVVYQELEIVQQHAVDPEAVRAQMNNIKGILVDDPLVPRSATAESCDKGVILFNAVDDTGQVISEGPFNKTVKAARQAESPTTVYPKLDSQGDFVRYRREGMVGNENRKAFELPSLAEFNKFSEKEIRELVESARTEAQKNQLVENLFPWNGDKQFLMDAPSGNRVHKNSDSQSGIDESGRGRKVKREKGAE